MLSSSTTSNSTTSDPKHVAMETYWREVHSIEEEKDGEEEEEEDERKSMDEVELEEAWLTDAGLASLVTGLPLADEEPPPAEVLLSTLTHQQATTVRKRLDNYNETLKKRNRQPIRDVRDIFTEPDDPADRCVYPHSHHAESPPSRYHTTTKTIRRRADRDSGVFGVPLNTLLEKDRKKFPGVKVPVVFQKLLCILEQTGLLTEGILRVPASAARVKCLRRELDRCYEGFDWSALRQVDASSLLKLFIRELPTPLLTHTHLSTYRSVLSIPSELHQVQALQLLTLLLPEANREILRVKLHPDIVYTVPKFLLSQVRQMNQVSIQKQLGLSWTSRLLRKKNDKNERDQITELCEGVIRVHAPLHTKISMVIQLEEQTTAKDITSRFECENSPVQHLYEVGGNICERRLHPDCVLLDVYRANPHCDWLIKP
ncbi:rho GTPase-activating protein 28 [Neolamprologus brichardi]|uniref:rho GTPase-activating protein 28 n=1 Tax=Neolamprologus brichardi TaxID=32507 RepID=UPI001643D045|nr:rho GTPase-activating protein 28 [Neolamprologus brichardi]